MDQRILNEQRIEEFRAYLQQEEKSEATIDKYIRDARAFCAFSGGTGVTKELARSWKQTLTEKGYAVRSVNSMLASLNSLLGFLGWEDCRVKSLKTQRQTYSPEEKELTLSLIHI